jgi:hypothetical protein
MEPQSDHPPEVVEFWVPSSTGSASPDTFGHAMSLLTAMSTATQLFVGLTGAVWAVLVPNTMALPTRVVALALFLHGLLGAVMFLVLRGLGANMVQRLNLSRWKVQYGDKEGMGDAAWFGVPPLRYGIKKTGLLHPGSWTKWARVPSDLQTQINAWTEKTGDQSIDRHYAVPRYPTLRIQRTAWPLVPFFGAACSFYLGVDAWEKRTEHEGICSSRVTLLQQASTSLDLDRARYLLDKANCDVSTQPISENPEQHLAACNERFALLRQATTSLDLDRARYLLDKANCDVSTQAISESSEQHKVACAERFALLRQASTPLDLDRARYLLDKANCDVSTQPIASSLPPPPRPLRGRAGR